VVFSPNELVTLAPAISKSSSAEGSPGSSWSATISDRHEYRHDECFARRLDEEV
jgi:hypothetical protein